MLENLNTHDLVEEFREVITNYNYEVPVNTQAVVALSGFPDYLPDGRIKDFSRENIARIWFATQLCREIAARRQGVPLEEADLLKGPRLILSGVTEELPAMEKIAIRRLGFPIEMVDQISNGIRGIGNTKTQIESLTTDPSISELHDLTFVTSGYHKPRVDRTADKILNKDINIKTIPVPYEVYNYDVFRKVRGEIKRIITYSKKGDISTTPSSRVK